MTNILGKSEKRFQVIIHIILIFMALAAILPLWVLVAGSVTGEQELILEGYSLMPKTFSLDAYKYLFYKASEIFRAYGITVFITVVGTAASLFITPLLAYPLSRKDFKARNIFSFLVFFTMLFNGGIVPSYIMWTRIFHLKNTITALILPGLLMNGFNVILMKNYFAQNIPAELIEAAKMDGAGEFKIFFKMILPLSLPIMATVGLFVGIGYWNDWTNGLYYVTDAKLYSLAEPAEPDPAGCTVLKFQYHDKCRRCSYDADAFCKYSYGNFRSRNSANYGSLSVLSEILCQRNCCRSGKGIRRGEKG